MLQHARRGHIKCCPRTNMLVFTQINRVLTHRCEKNVRWRINVDICEFSAHGKRPKLKFFSSTVEPSAMISGTHVEIANDC